MQFEIKWWWVTSITLKTDLRLVIHRLSTNLSFDCSLQSWTCRQNALCEPNNDKVTLNADFHSSLGLLKWSLLSLLHVSEHVSMFSWKHSMTWDTRKPKPRQTPTLESPRAACDRGQTLKYIGRNDANNLTSCGFAPPDSRSGLVQEVVKQSQKVSGYTHHYNKAVSVNIFIRNYWRWPAVPV